MVSADVAAGGEPTCIIIPSRFASARYPGKPLARIRGHGGVDRSLVEWTWRAAMRVPDVSKVLVATDDDRVAETVRGFGGEVVMTPSDCVNGTERCAAAAEYVSDDFDLFINFQGDSPLTPPEIVASLGDRMKRSAFAVATPAIECSGATRDYLIAEQQSGRIGGTTIVPNHLGEALYFSKAILPHGASDDASVPLYLHLGVYAYRRHALATYVRSSPSVAEKAEGLEQLRFLDRGIGVQVVVFPQPSEGTLVELNNPEDLKVIEAELLRRGLD